MDPTAAVGTNDGNMIRVMSGDGKMQTWTEQLEMENTIAKWATWPTGSGHGWGHMGKFLIRTAAVVGVLLAITWGLAYALEEDHPTCQGAPMIPGDTCIFYNPEQTLSYDQMVQRAAATQSHPIAWTATAIVLTLAVLELALQVKRLMTRRDPTPSELENFMGHRNAMRSKLEADVLATPGDPDAQRWLAFFDSAVAKFARGNRFRVVEDRAVPDEPTGRDDSRDYAG